MATTHRCSHCEKYERQGHNYCRMCGFHLTAGYVQHVGVATIYHVNERFCGCCGGPAGRCRCVRGKGVANEREED